MKKGICCLALLLCLCLCVPALAETTSRQITARDVSMSRYTGSMAVKDVDSGKYQLFSATGEALTGADYSYMSTSSEYGFFKVEVEAEDGVHDEGLIASDGRVIIPPEYADTNVVSARWQVGIKLTPCEADDKDYTFSWSNGEKKFFRIDTADLFFDGQKVGSLPRSSYDGYPTAHGAYICIQNREKQRFYYDSAMNARQVEYTGEYDTTYKGGKTYYTHNATGQPAFTAECTLTSADVDNDLIFEGGAVYDLQGNELARTQQNYDTVKGLDNGYWRVKVFGSYGVVNSQLQEVIPAVYDDIAYDTVLDYGYIGAVKDGKFGYLDLNGNVTCDFVYGKDNANNRGTFATVKNLDGTIIVLSAAVGELPEHYAEVNVPGYTGCLAFVATNTAGEKGLVGLNGETLIPFSADYRDISVTQDGRTAVVSLGSRAYEIYNLDEQDLTAVAPAPAPEPATEPAPAGDGETWTCANGHAGNTGKFCSECGAPMPEPEPEPEDDGAWTCPNGHAGNTGKFCSECGAPRPEEEPEDDGTWTCPNGHAGNTGKFCSECGAAKPEA